MRISIEEGLENLKQGLSDLGYEVYSFRDNVSSDAYIYSERNTGLHNLKNSINPGSEGSLLVDADGKSLREIEYILNHRVYSPLFNITSSPADYV